MATDLDPLDGRAVADTRTHGVPVLVWVGMGLFVIGVLTAIVGPIVGAMDSMQKIEKLNAPTPADLGDGTYVGMFAVILGIVAAVLGVTFALVGILLRVRASRDSAS